MQRSTLTPGKNLTRRDEVIRREVRQYESAWFDSDKVKLSRDRIDRLGYFETVTAEPKPVPGTRDQVDLEVNVKERPTGSISLGAGYSTSDGIILSAGFAQNNVFGTGNSVSVDVNTSKSQRTYALSVVEPYITPEGISRSWDISDRKVDLDELDVADVTYETRALGVSWGIPFTELDRVFLGGRWEMTSVDTNENSPQRYKNYKDQFGDDPMSLALTLGWSRDSRDNSLAPTRGVYQRLNGEFGLPGLDIQYYKLTYQYQQFIPLSRTWTLAFNGEVGYGDVYGSTSQFPFFKNFYAGGIGSVRGFNSGTLGPKDYSYTYQGDTDADNLGGDRMLTGSIEVLAPLPGSPQTRITAAITRFRDLVKSTWFSTTLRTPIAEIIPYSMKLTPPMMADGIEPMTSAIFGIKLRITAKTAAIRMTRGSWTRLNSRTPVFSP